MEQGTSRRNFLKLAFKQTAPEPAPLTPTTVRAGATERAVSLDELLVLAGEHGLSGRLDAVRALARTSVRLVHGGSPGPCAPGRSCLGGEPDLPSDVAWPEWDDERLDLLAQLELAELAPLLPAGTLPQRGRLLVFYAAPGMRAEHSDVVRLLLVDAPVGAEAPDATGYPLMLSAELTLPRQSAGPVVALGLDAAEAVGWSDLRDRLAGLQGVTPEDRARDFRALHRLLGWPDEPASPRPLAPAAHERSDGWRLLLQLSSDDEIGWQWGRPRTRLFVWVHEDRLAAGDFSAVRAFPQ